MNKRVARENLFLLKKIFDEQGITFRIGYGTLLGFVREKNFISGDNDIDLVLMQSERVRVDCVLGLLKVKGFEVVKQANCFITFRRKGVLVDLYFFAQRNIIDKILNRFTCAYGVWCIYIPKHFLFLDNDECFHWVYFRGKQFYTFRNYCKWLERTYGDYLVPSDKKGNTRTFFSKYFMRARIFARSRLKGVWFDLAYNFYLWLFK